jgi:pyridoxamine 5'-phosphate oxidase
MYWHELGRQVRFEGLVVRSPATESDAYFASRPLPSQINAWSSEQSRPLTDPAALEERAAQVLATKPGAMLPRPQFWGGFRLWLEALELWVEGENRFHERVRYERHLDARDAHNFEPGRWTWQRLQP